MTEKVSFSRVECWRECPRKYKYRYLDKIPQELDMTPTNPLILGSAMDKGIEHGVEVGIEYYYSQYPIITDAHVTEAMKLEYWIPKMRSKLNGGKFQIKIESDRFIGYADYIEDDKLLIDFKYSNHTEKYEKSPQLSLYASELPIKPEMMCYACVPKTFIRQKNDESLQQFRKRVIQTLNDMDIQLVWMEYDQDAVDSFWKDAERMSNDKVCEACHNDNCKYCEYAKICTIEDEKPKRKIKPRSEIKL